MRYGLEQIKQRALETICLMAAICLTYDSSK